MESFSKLQAVVIQSADNAQKLIHGNKSAGERLRKQMQEVKHLAQVVREDALALYKEDK